MQCLPQSHTGSADGLQVGFYHQHIIEMGGFMKMNLGMTHHKNNAVFLPQFLLLEAQQTQPFRARTLCKPKIIGVIDDAARVCIIIVDAKGNAVMAVVEKACGR